MKIIEVKIINYDSLETTDILMSKSEVESVFGSGVSFNITDIFSRGDKSFNIDEIGFEVHPEGLSLIVWVTEMK